MVMPEAVLKQGAPPNWSGYIAVDDVDATVEKAKGLGATIHMPPTDIPEVGRFAVVGDPQGAVFMPFRPLPPPTPPVAPPPGSPGTVGWHELYASDWEKAFAFYSDMFGWKKDQAMDMGPELGTYQLFTLASGGPAIGGTRMAPDVSLEECFRLARAMTLKNAAAGLPHGGAKSVIFGDW